MQESVETHLKTGTSMMERTIKRIQDQGVKDTDLGATLDYLVMLAEHGAEVASIIETVMDELPSGHVLMSTRGILTRLAIGHVARGIDTAVMLGAYARRDLKELLATT